MMFAVVWMRMTPQAHLFEQLVPSEWNCLGRIRRPGLAGESVSLDWAMRSQKSCQAQFSPPPSLCVSETVSKPSMAMVSLHSNRECSSLLVASSPGMSSCISQTFSMSVGDNSHGCSCGQGTGPHLRYCFKALVTVFTSQSTELSRSSSLHVFSSGEQAKMKNSLKIWPSKVLTTSQDFLL